MQIRSIIYPTDFSGCALNALEYAVNIAKLYQAELVIAHSEPEPVLGGITEGERKKEHRQEIAVANVQLEEMKNNILSRHPMLTVKTILLQGENVDPVINVVEKNHADLVVMGTLGAGGLSQLLIGSYAAKLMSKVTCPVLIVPSKASYKGFSKIIYASSLMNSDIGVVKELTDLAKLYQAEVSILNIREDDQMAEDELFSFEKETRENTGYPKLDFIFFKGSNINKHIQDYSERNKADLIVMTVKKKTFLDKLFNSSHTEKMAYHTHVPLLVFHEKH